MIVVLPEFPIDSNLIACHANLDELPEIVALTRASQLDTAGAATASETSVTDLFTTPSNVERTRMITVRREAVLIATAALHYDKADRFFIDIAIDPGLDEELHTELRTILLAWAEQNAHQNLDFFGLDKARLLSWAWQRNQRLIDSLEAAGYCNDRCYIDMAIDLPPTTPVGAPGDVIVRQLDLDDPAGEDAHIAHQIITETFRDHHDFIARTFEIFMARRTESSDFDPNGWFVAEIDGVPAGVAICDNSHLEADNAAYVANLGTLRWARGRGVAKALLAAVFARAEADGRTSVQLSVDAESPTGATHLYEKAGMRRDKTGFVFQKPFGAI